MVATGLSGASGSITVPDVGDWARAFIEPQWAAQDDNQNAKLFARVTPGAGGTDEVDWQTGASVSGAALALHIARNPLIAVNHGTFTQPAASSQNWYGPTVSPIALARSGLIATISNADTSSGYVACSKQCRFYSTTQLRFWGRRPPAAISTSPTRSSTSARRRPRR